MQIFVAFSEKVNFNNIGTYHRWLLDYLTQNHHPRQSSLLCSWQGRNQEHISTWKQITSCRFTSKNFALGFNTLSHNSSKNLYTTVIFLEAENPFGLFPQLIMTSYFKKNKKTIWQKKILFYRSTDVSKIQLRCQERL